MMWTKEYMDDQTGKTVIVTGANTGLGYEDALAFYEKGATVIITCRSIEKATEAVDRIILSGGTGNIAAYILDLSDLQSITSFAAKFKSAHSQLHLLINNAGIMMPPPGQTADGHELQFGVNFLGHFALTALLYPLIKLTPDARVITLSSGAYKWVEDIDFENLKMERDYDPRREYGISKLADIMFTLELQRRIDKAGDKVLSLAAHPGITLTELQRHVPDLVEQLAKYPVIMEPWQGALPTLYAAVSADVTAGGYYGPDGENELSGYPALAVVGVNAQNVDTAKNLWDYAEKATGLKFDLNTSA